jgi:hypothetical protein
MKTVIVLGTHNSGSGLVHDYLACRNDFNSPFDHNEFRICTDPRGLNYLYTNCYKNNGFFNASHAISEFLNFIDQIEKFKVHQSKGVLKKIYNKNILKHSKTFIKNITDVQYFAAPHYKRIGLTLSEKLNIRLSKKLLKKTLPEMKVASIILPKNEKIFIKEGKQLIKNIIFNNTKKTLIKNRNVVLNNAADILNPIETSRFYENAKIIVVTRDPRDIFTSMKSRQSMATPWYDVDIFIKWYKKCFDKNIYLDKKNPLILRLKFEEIIKNFDKENNKICKFLNINLKFDIEKKKHFEFNLEKSKKNIYKSKKYLSKKEFSKIEKQLKNYLQW